MLFRQEAVSDCDIKTVLYGGGVLLIKVEY
jgi:hypothetical protein